ncbi:MAG: CHAT domain-containing protein [Fibrobacteria bacterium]|nr:CHAT domain-containing protein [Fibrobacteria bacterium]
MSTKLRIDIREDNEGLYFQYFHLDSPSQKAVAAKYRPLQVPIIEEESARLAAVFETAFRKGNGWVNALRDWGDRGFVEFLPGELQKIISEMEKGTLLWFLCCETALTFPWELLHDGNDFINRKLACGRIVEGNGSGARSLPNPNKKVVILADLAGNLPEAYEEGLYINDLLAEHSRLKSSASLLSSKPELVTEAGRESVLYNLQTAGFVHFCGHSQSTGRDNESGWILSNNERLNLNDIRELGKRDKVPALVISNSCSSSDGGAYSCETFSGIAGAFLSAGVAGYIGTICAIEDKAAREFAALYYPSLSTEKTFAQALHSLQRNLPVDNPLWAVFRYYGDPEYQYYPEIQVTSSKKDEEASPKMAESCSGANDSKSKKIWWWLIIAFIIAIIAGWMFIRGKEASPGNFLYQEGTTSPPADIVP